MFSPYSTSLHFNQNKKENRAGKLFRQTRSVFRPMEGEPVQKVRRDFLRLDSLEGDCHTYNMSTNNPTDHLSKNLETLKQNMDLKQPPTKAESKWFGSYQDHSYTSPYTQKKTLVEPVPVVTSPVSATSFYDSFYESGPYVGSIPDFHHTHSPIQLPYNLTKGEFEYWTMMPTECQGLAQSHCFQASSQPSLLGYCPSQSVYMTQPRTSWFGGVVGWFLGTGGSTEASIKPCQEETKVVPKVNSLTGASSLNPNAKVFTPPLNPNAKEFTPAKRNLEPADLTTTTVASDFDVESKTAVQDSIDTKATPAGISLTTLQCSEPALSSCDDNTSEKVFSENITPTGSVTVTPSGSACVTPAPDMETVMKATTSRLCTPWVHQDAGLRCIETDEETLESDVECDGLLSDDSGDESDEEEDEDEDEDDLTNTPTCDVRFRSRQRSLSSCSDESFIEFTASSPGESPVITCDNKSFGVKKSSAVKKFVVSDISVDSDDESQDEDNFGVVEKGSLEVENKESHQIDERHEQDENEFDSEAEDWDEIDRSHIDDDEFRQQMTDLGLFCPLLVSSFTNGCVESNSDETGSADSCSASETRKPGKRFVIENVSPSKCCPEESHPSTVRPPKEEVERRLKLANDLWHLNYDCQDVVVDVCENAAMCGLSPKKKLTTFSSKEDWVEIYEDPIKSEALRLARTGDFARSRADHDRMERLIGPILAPDHRQKMWNKIYSSQKEF